MKSGDSVQIHPADTDDPEAINHKGRIGICLSHNSTKRYVVVYFSDTKERVVFREKDIRVAVARQSTAAKDWMA
jgi:hypothetical protein